MMKKINIEKRYYTNNKDVVVAVAFTDGYRYRAEARCHPNDVFDYEFGKRLASLRCDHAIMQDRVDLYTNWNKEAEEALKYVQKEKERSERRLAKAKEMRETVENDLKKLLEAGVVEDYECE